MTLKEYNRKPVGNVKERSLLQQKFPGIRQGTFHFSLERFCSNAIVLIKPLQQSANATRSEGNTRIGSAIIEA